MFVQQKLTNCDITSAHTVCFLIFSVICCKKGIFHGLRQTLLGQCWNEEEANIQTHRKGILMWSGLLNGVITAPWKFSVFMIVSID